MIAAQTLRVLVEPREGPTVLFISWLLLGFDLPFALDNLFHLYDFGSAEDVRELNGTSSVFLVLNNLVDAFFDGRALCYSFVVHVALVSILVAP